MIIEETTLGASTDEKGYFSIINIPAGTYILKASRVGYSTRIVENVKVNAGRTTTKTKG